MTHWLPVLIVIGLSVLTLAIPPRYDPAIRLREWLEKKR